jgi:WD40 repeat protein
MSRTLGPALAALLLVGGWTIPQARPAEEPASQRLRVICPAVQVDDQRRTNAPDEETRPPELIVLGKPRRLPDSKDPACYEVAVEKVLYGSWPGGTVQFSSDWSVGDERRIFILMPQMYRIPPADKPFKLRDFAEPSEEKAVRALAAARLDYNCLASECLFVGKEIELRDAYRRTVEVVKPLAGNAPRKSEQVCVEYGGYFQVGDKKPDVRKEPEVYFIRDIHRTPEETVYRTICRLPADQEAAVLAARKRRDQFPVVETTEDGKPVRYREVLFRGSHEEALELLGAWSDAAVLLGQRKLVQERRTSKPPVIAAIEKGLPRTTEKGPTAYRLLRNLIGVLGEIQRREGTDADLRRLIDSHLEHLAANPPQPPTPPKRVDSEYYFLGEENRTDVNHGLAWLLRQLAEDRVHKEYGPRLLRLRDQVQGQWKKEVQLALDVCDIEDRLDLDQALRRFKDIKPASTGQEMRHDGPCVLAFSHDGQFLASAGHNQVCVWKTRDWTQVSRWPLEASISAVRFSPDDRLLYVAGGAAIPIHARYDWRTGKVERSYTAHQKGLCGLEVSADGKRMASADYYRNVFHVCDTETGKIQKTFSMQGVRHQFTLSPDGKALVRATAFPKDPVGGKQGPMAPGWVAEAVEGKPLPLRDPSGKDVWLFSPAGRYLISGEAPDPAAPVPQLGLTLRVHDAGRDFAEVASRREQHFGRFLTISADGTRLAVADHGFPGGAPGGQAWQTTRAGIRFTVLTLPELKPVSTCEIQTTRDSIDLRSAALSPDGKTLAVALAYHRTPYLFDTATGERLMPTRGHPGRIENVLFPPGGKTLRSLDSQNFVCLWDAASLRLLGRVSFPGSFQVLSARPPDGKYLICRDLAADGSRVVLKVIDADTGGIMSTLELPEWDRFARPLFLWLNESEVILYVGEQLLRLDLRQGKVVKEIKAERDSPGEGRYSRALALDETDYAWITANPRFGSVEGWSVDILTGKARSLGKKDLPRLTGNRGGLVPGGRWFYVTDPDLYLLDRKTLEVTAEKHFRGVDLLDLVFSGDGGRYAVVTGGRIYVDRDLRRLDPQTQSLVRVHETAGGKTLAAFPAATRWARCRLSPDGKRLVVINDDDTLESWDLSASR